MLARKNGLDPASENDAVCQFNSQAQQPEAGEWLLRKSVLLERVFGGWVKACFCYCTWCALKIRHGKPSLEPNKPVSIRSRASVWLPGAFLRAAAILRHFKIRACSRECGQMEFLTRSLMECICMTHLSFYSTCMARQGCYLLFLKLPFGDFQLSRTSKKE